MSPIQICEKEIVHRTMRWDFPVDACERPTSWGVQPWSALMNGLILWNLINKRSLCKPHVRHLLDGMVLFEGLHLGAHLYNLHTRANTILVHYVLMFTVLSIYRMRSTRYHPALVVHVALDAFVVLTGESLAMIMSGLSLGGHVLYRLNLPQPHRALILSMLAIVVLITAEALICERMMQLVELPYHVLVEGAGYVAFNALANLVLTLPVGDASTYH